MYDVHSCGSVDQPRIRKAGYIGWVGHNNLGDEAMYYAFKELLFRRLDINLFAYGNMNKRFDIAFLGGGTLINRSVGYLHLFQEAQASCSQSYVFGTGVCSDEFWRTRPRWIDRMAEWRDCLHRANFLGVRGPLSKQRLTEHGIKNVEVIGDLALSLAQPTVKPKKFRKNIGINIGISYGNVWGNERSILAFIIRAGSELIKRGWKITFVPMWPPDVGYIEIAAKMISSSKVNIFHDFLSIPKTLDVLENMDVFVGEKLHSVTLSMCVYTPSIMLEYRPKCQDFMASMGLETFNMPTNMLSLKRLLHLVEELYDNIPRYQNVLKERIGYYAQKQQQCANAISTREKLV